MHFVLETVTSHGVRMGKVLLRDGKGVLETPFCLLYARGGVVPHLTSDVVRDISCVPPASMLCLPHLYELPGTEVLEQHRLGVHTFLGLEDDQLVYLSMQDPCSPPDPSYNEQKNISVWTNGGRRKLTVADHLRFVGACQPTVYESLCDVTPMNGCQLKRVRKSVDRTLQFLDQTLAFRSSSQVLQNCSLLGAVVGGALETERIRSATETAKRPVDGFVIEGFDFPHDDVSCESVITSVTQHLPQDKLRFIHGMNSPDEVFTAVESGVDVFDGSYAYSATEHGRALVFPLPPSLTRCLGDEGATNTHPAADGTSTRELDLNEDRYAADFAPILSGCSCYSCSHYTRAYVHHLLSTREILGSVLLMIHNLSHYLLFFHCLRQVARSGNYSQFKDFCSSHISSKLES